MRFTVAWADVISENHALKVALGCFALVLVVLSVAVLTLSSRKPLLIERACYSRAVPTLDPDRTPAEVETFVREALPMRFDTQGNVSPGFLAESEESFRSQEQQDLKKRGIAEKIVINSIAVNGDKITVDADRIFSVGSVRSVLPFPLILTVGTVDRTQGNPYGLIVLQVSAPKSDAQAQGAKQ